MARSKSPTLTEAELRLMEIVWEQGDLVLALWAPDLTEEAFLAIARSVRTVPEPVE